MIAKPPGWPFLIVWSALAFAITYWASVPFWYRAEMFLAAIFVGLPLLYPETVIPQETADDAYRYLIANWYGYHGWDGW